MSDTVALITTSGKPASHHQKSIRGVVPPRGFEPRTTRSLPPALSGLGGRGPVSLQPGALPLSYGGEARASILYLRVQGVLNIPYCRVLYSSV